ncbi:DUF1641 domain-containing protein [Fictibacillus gelatini]|uniref:DUF1641 domain-containing protein n=1 Tax=Fictibacillus gelatini TaxID=225985 RepID=UPI0004225268|nr:DUF1641 domain-containing protein [Fictibacillus gelatini]
MAKPITKIEEPVLTEKEKQDQSLQKVLEDVSKNADGIKETIQLLQELHESGILGAINHLVEAKEQVAKIAVGQMLRPPVTNALNNAMAAAGVLTEIDPETTKKLTAGLSKGLQKAEEGLRTNKKVGVFDLVKLLKDPDINRVITFSLDLLKGLGEGLKD